MRLIIKTNKKIKEEQNMKKTVKIISTILIALFVVCAVANVALADGVDPSQFTGSQGNMNTENINNVGNQVIYLIRLIGTMISVGVLVVLGVKYMTASPEGKADFKSTMIPYLVGAVLVFAATWIASAIYGFATGIGK